MISHLYQRSIIRGVSSGKDDPWWGSVLRFARVFVREELLGGFVDFIFSRRRFAVFFTGFELVSGWFSVTDYLSSITVSTSWAGRQDRIHKLVFSH